LINADASDALWVQRIGIGMGVLFVRLFPLWKFWEDCIASIELYFLETSVVVARECDDVMF